MKIVIEIDNTNVGDERHTGADEALFNFGIGKPDARTGEQWCNMSGESYRVTSISVDDEVIFAPTFHLDRLPCNSAWTETGYCIEHDRLAFFRDPAMPSKLRNVILMKK